MAAFYLRRHMESCHVIVLSHIRGLNVGVGGLGKYVMSSPQILKSGVCLVEGCTTRVNIPGRLWGDFMYRHWKAKVAIIQEGTKPLPICDQCRIHIPTARLFKHSQMDKCNKVTERRIGWRYVEMAARCGKMECSL